MGAAPQTYTPRHAFYDVNKLRGKGLLDLKRAGVFGCNLAGIRILAGMLILREKFIKPMLAGAGKKHVGRPGKNIHSIDKHYENYNGKYSVPLKCSAWQLEGIYFLPTC